MKMWRVCVWAARRVKKAFRAVRSEDGGAKRESEFGTRRGGANYIKRGVLRSEKENKTPLRTILHMRNFLILSEIQSLIS